MTRLHTFLLALLSAIGWGCAFALIGLTVFKGEPSQAAAALVFAAFGVAAGVLLLVLKLTLERQLPRNLTSALRPDRADAAASSAASDHAANAVGA